MNFLEEKQISCPYCGETIEVLLDQQDTNQEYIEDCQVCCKPITFIIRIDHQGDLMVSVHDENEAF